MQIQTKQYVNGGKFLLPLLIFTAIWAYIFTSSGIVDAGFNYFVDDQQIILNHQNYTSFDDILVEPFTSLLSSIPKSRFRPLYDVFIRLFAQIYGLNPALWYLSSCLVAILTTSIFYLIGILQKFSDLEAAGFAALIVFGQQAATYTRFGTPETTATLLVAITILLGSLNFKHRQLQITINFLFLVFALLSALNKEACILFLPALSFFKVWHLSNQRGITLKQAFVENRVVVISGLSIFAILIFYIKFSGIEGPGYAGIDRETLSIAHLVSSLTANGAIFGSAIFANMIYLSKYRDRQIGGFYIFMALAIVPQLIIYNKTGMVWHYALPAAIGVAWLTFYPISQVRKKSAVSSKVITTVILVVICLQIVFTKTYFQTVANRVSSIQSLIADVSTCVDRQDLFVIVGNPYTDLELLDSFKTIADRVIARNQIYLATYGSQKSQIELQIMKEQEQPLYFLNPELLEANYQHMTIDRLDDRGRSRLKGVIVTNAQRVEQPLAKLNLDWFQPEHLTKKYYPKLDMSVYCKK